MRKNLILLYLCLMGLLIWQTHHNRVQADSSPFDKPVTELTQADLKEFIELGFAEKISVEQAKILYEQLSQTQKEIVSNLVAEQAGIPLELWEKEKANNKINYSVNLLNSINPLWRQFVENTWTLGYPNGSTFASTYYVDRWCENATPPDPDSDWVFHFNMSYSQNPNGLRWTSKSTQVYLAFMSAYGGNINSFSYSWSHVKLCIGTAGVEAAGGTENVKNNVFLHPNN